jgi:DNA-binding LytR/AlgR family response regulator
MKVMIIEDEQLNIDVLKDHIQNYNHTIEIVACLKSKEDVNEWYQQYEQVDLVFSDIELLDGNVFSLLKQNIIQSPIIFTTAYNTFYQEAFDVNGIAYLLKPISFEKFSKAMQKFENLKPQSADFNWNKLSELIHQSSKTYKERLIIKNDSELKILLVENLALVLSNAGKCIAIDEKGQQHEFRYKLSDLILELNPKKFFQINRSEIINIHYIDKIESYFGDRLAIKVKNYKTTLITSAAVTSDFRKWIES